MSYVVLASRAILATMIKGVHVWLTNAKQTKLSAEGLPEVHVYAAAAARKQAVLQENR
jgi:hypothetical protein